MNVILECVVSIVYNLVSAEVVLVSFKIAKRTMRPDMSYIRCCNAFYICHFIPFAETVKTETRFNSFQGVPESSYSIIS